MGNCQAIDAATLVIQHPNGKVEKCYGAVNASEVMKMNPGHYVALLISTTLCPNPKSKANGADQNKGDDDHSHKVSDTTNEKKTTSTTGSVRITRIKLLRPTDTLVLGQVYRLITTQEVMKGLWAKKQAKGKRSNQFEPLTAERLQRETAAAASRRSEAASELDKDNNQVMTKSDRRHHRPRTSPSSSGSSGNSQAAATARPRTWQPSLQSISEAAS
ncbi:PREDICTED: uncharacterized protein LOC101296959 [Fragaria vesca subsp. vesca]|uniref:uncharacterized protein LOC101296959 n=1 Tax=Fragaria vesca subsp. vesca TaxID=101020 RepID=UPI0002C36918|nr:PREDICTED: uncharacterized protein LOC101296959 [Fragaria vesca subsp. vesca]